MSKRRGKKLAEKKRLPANSRCRDCGVIFSVPRWQYFKAARPRCMACGGLLEYGAPMYGTR